MAQITEQAYRNRIMLHKATPQLSPSSRSPEHASAMRGRGVDLDTLYDAADYTVRTRIVVPAADLCSTSVFDRLIGSLRTSTAQIIFIMVPSELIA